MRVRPTLLRLLVIAVLLLLYIAPFLLDWPVILSFILFGIVVLVQKKPTPYPVHFLVFAILVTFFYFGLLPAPYQLLEESGFAFGSSILTTLVYMALVLGFLFTVYLTLVTRNRSKPRRTE